MTDKQREKIKSMRERFCSYAEIADELCLPLSSVKSFCLRNNLNTETLIKDAKVCKHCGKPIVVCSKTKPRLFCSTECKAAWWKEHKAKANSKLVKEHICHTCKKPFFDYASANRKYCSLACYQRRNQDG